MTTQLRAGTARSVITPPLGIVHGTWRLRSGKASGVHDELLADALVLETPETTLALVSLDLLAVDAAFSDEVRREASLITGIAPDAIIVNASHNHLAPAWPLEPAASDTPLERWRNSMVDRVVGCIAAAHRTMVPARMGSASFPVQGLATNRVWPSRAVDERATLVRIDALDGTPLMTVTSFACHALTVGGHTLDWGADFPGVIRARLEAQLPGSRSMFLQGSAGDIAPYDFWFGNPDPQPMGFVTMEQFGAEFAEAALRARSKVRTSTRARLGWVASPLTLGRRQLVWSAAELASARSQLGAPPVQVPEVWPQHVHTTTSAQETPGYYQHLALNSLESIHKDRGIPVETTLRAVQLGSLTLLATPFELFSELAGAVVSRRPADEDITVLGYCDDYLGYFPPDGALRELSAFSLEEQLDQDKSRWAYGITNTRIADGEGEVFVRASVALVDTLPGR
jgi:hypothetical protein